MTRQIIQEMVDWEVQMQLNKKIKICFLCFVVLLASACAKNKIMQFRSYGIDYLENADYESALEYFNEAIKLGNGEVGKVQYDLLLYKAECLFMLKRYSEAREIYTILLDIDKNNKVYRELYNSVTSIVGLVEFKNALDNDNIEEAEKIFAELKEVGLEHEKSVMFNQAVLLEKKSEWKNALNAFNYYLKQYPGDEDALHEIEFINAQLNNGNY